MVELRICKFCQQPASYESLPQMESFGIKVFFCHPCRAEYLYWSQNNIFLETPSSVSLYVTINDKTYRWSREGHYGRLWYVGKPGVPGKHINGQMIPILSFKEADSLNLTPQNIESKIRSWLIFL
jgi:hypothetical protein